MLDLSLLVCFRNDRTTGDFVIKIAHPIGISRIFHVFEVSSQRHVEDKTRQYQATENLNNNKICKIYKFRIQKERKKLIKDFQWRQKRSSNCKKERVSVLARKKLLNWMTFYISLQNLKLRMGKGLELRHRALGVRVGSEVYFQLNP